MPWDDDLTGVHLDVAAEEGSPVHVLAGPGTGKTFAMMRRIARLLENDADPQKVLAVTFTRTAARDLKEQLEGLKIAGAEEVRATTLHSLCFSALSREEVFSMVGRIARPLLSHERKQMIKDLAQRFNGTVRTENLLEAYEAAWARLQHEDAGHPRSPQDIDFQNHLLDWLRYHRAMLIGELVPLSLDFLRNNPAINIFPKFDHILVDEFQDLNKSDQTLISELANDCTLTVIGDDNQSIYSFRYANPDGIRIFPEENPDSINFVIHKCKRCPPNIVEISNALISNDSRRTRDEPLQVDSALEPAEIYIVQHPTLNDEIDSIADFVHHYLEENEQVPPGQVLILSTRRFIGHRIRQALIDRGKNALSYFVEDELKKTSAAEGYCLLKLMVDPNDRAALRAWLGLGSKTGYVGSYTRLRAYSQQESIEPRDALEAIDQDEITIPFTAPLLARYKLLKGKLADIEDLEGLELVRALWATEDMESRAIRILAESLAYDVPEPAELLQTLTEAITQPELPGSNSDVIRIMSLHKSKGLTASVVIVAGCVAGALPHIDQSKSEAEKDAQLEEQRRLFYVAITRATSKLIISSSATMELRDAMAGNVQTRGHFLVGDVPMVYTSSSPLISELGSTAPASIDTRAWRKRAGF